MKFSQARQGRIFILRLEDGEVVHETIEQFARQQGIRSAVLTLHGGADEASHLVVGPRETRCAPPIEPLVAQLEGAHEVVGLGTIFPDASGTPVLHAHLACGRLDRTTTGCIRVGVKTWHVLEVVLVELLDSTARRLRDAATGFELLVP